jgi:hypothetical protein
MGDLTARLKQLRSRFERAKKRLESLPETGMSEDGQPYIQEVAEALQSFAAWFGQLTFDHCSMFGSARRFHAALAGLDAIVDWVGLHRSPQFASDLAEQVAELVEQGEALDAAVAAAFLVERSPSRVVYRTPASISSEKRDAIEDDIQSVASLAGHLGVRLQRIALMTGSQPNKPGRSKPARRRDRKGVGGRPAKFPIKFIREVVAARERDRKHARTSRRPLPPIPRWLSDYCTAKQIDIGKTFPQSVPGEAWSDRANRFWKAATKRLREAETNRH